MILKDAIQILKEQYGNHPNLQIAQKLIEYSKTDLNDLQKRVDLALAAKQVYYLFWQKVNIGYESYFEEDVETLNEALLYNTFKERITSCKNLAEFQQDTEVAKFAVDFVEEIDDKLTLTKVGVAFITVMSYYNFDFIFDLEPISVSSLWKDNLHNVSANAIESLYIQVVELIKYIVEGYVELPSDAFVREFAIIEGFVTGDVSFYRLTAKGYKAYWYAIEEEHYLKYGND